MVGTSSGREGGNCIAVVVWGHLAKENAPPSAAFFGGDGELERGLAGGVTEDRGAGKKAPAQGGQLRALGLTARKLLVIDVDDDSYSGGECVGSIEYETFISGGDADFEWQRGYSAFTVSHSQVDTICRYLQGQEEHHRKTSFQEEYIAFLKRHDIEFEEQYLFEGEHVG